MRKHLHIKGVNWKVQSSELWPWAQYVNPTISSEKMSQTRNPNSESSVIYTMCGAFAHISVITVQKNYWFSDFESFGQYLSFAIKKFPETSAGKNLKKNGKGLDCFFFWCKILHIDFLMENERCAPKDTNSVHQNNFYPETTQI